MIKIIFEFYNQRDLNKYLLILSNNFYIEFKTHFYWEIMCDSDDDSNEDPWDYYDKVKDALYGLFEILNISLDPNSVYYKCGVDNLEALKNSLIDLLMKDYDTLDLQDTLRRIEFNIKKSLFFDSSKKKEKKQGEESII